MFCTFKTGAILKQTLKIDIVSIFTVIPVVATIETYDISIYSKFAIRTSEIDIILRSKVIHCVTPELDNFSICNRYRLCTVLIWQIMPINIFYTLLIFNLQRSSGSGTIYLYISI